MLPPPKCSSGRPRCLFLYKDISWSFHTTPVHGPAPYNMLCHTPTLTLQLQADSHAITQEGISPPAWNVLSPNWSIISISYLSYRPTGEAWVNQLGTGNSTTGITKAPLQTANFTHIQVLTADILEPDLLTLD